MKSIVVILLLCCGAVQLAVCQTTDCSDIGEGVQPDTNGADIQGVCPNIPSNVLQCCTQDFLEDRIDQAEDYFQDGLRDELQQRFVVARQILQQLREYLNGTFLENYVNQFSSLPGARGFVNRFRNFLTDEDDDDDDNDDGDNGDDNDDNEQSNDISRSDAADERQFLDRVMEELVQDTVNFARSQTDDLEVQNCVQDVVQGHFEESNEQINAEGLRNVDLALKTIDRLEGLLDNITSRLSGFRPLGVCVRTLVRLNTCGRCVSPRPPFCRNICGALARACYSPFNNALEGQFESLWQFVRRVINVVDDTLDKLEDYDLFNVNVDGLLTDLGERCGRGLFGQRPTNIPGRARRQDSETTTESEDSDSMDDGSTDETDDGEDSVTDSDGIGRKLRLPAIIKTLATSLRRGPFGYPGRGIPGLCRRLRLRNGNCWNGDEELDNDIPEFNVDDIEGQDQNPVIQIPPEELQVAAQALGTPITDVIEDPEFQAVVPQTLTVPGSSAASGLVTSVTGVAISLLLAIFML